MGKFEGADTSANCGQHLNAPVLSAYFSSYARAIVPPSLLHVSVGGYHARIINTSVVIPTLLLSCCRSVARLALYLKVFRPYIICKILCHSPRRVHSSVF